MREDELRRTPRVKVCCRVDVRDRFGIWTAVTEDVCGRGCRLVTTKVPRLGSLLDLTLSSDLFSEVLEVTGYAAWVSDHRVGVNFASASRSGGMSPADWVDELIQHARVLGPEPVGSTGPRLVPSVRRPPLAARPHRVKTALSDDFDPESALALPRRNG